MKVYILKSTYPEDGENGSISGVFSTKEKAVKYLYNIFGWITLGVKRQDAPSEKEMMQYHDIQEYEVE